MKPTLLILAAGVGSRYGGLKQVDGMGPGGEAILEYAVFDAIKAGFGKIVFVIRQDIAHDFQEKVGKKIAPHIETVYAFQELNSCLEWYDQPIVRQKPWGTAHAILSAKAHLNTPFAVINADDFYGADALAAIGQFLSHECQPDCYGMVAYRINNTLSENGAVSRGVCAVNEAGFLTEVTERTKIARQSNGEIAYTDDDGHDHVLAEDTPVSMNFWGLHHTILGEIEAQFRDFVLANTDKPKAEFYIPTVVNNLIKSGKIKLKVDFSESQWYGVTYPEDKGTVQGALSAMAASGIYPKGLF